MEKLILKDAIFKMEEGDRFNFEEGSNFIIKTDEHNFNWRINGVQLTVGDYLDYADSIGVIIKKKQEPIREKDAWENFFPPSSGIFKRIDFTTIWEESAENERLYYAELVDMCDRYFKKDEAIKGTDFQAELRKSKQHQEENE